MSVSQPRMVDGLYYGNLDGNCANMIRSIVQNEEVKGLKHKIFNFPAQLILKAIKEERSIRSMIEAGEINAEDYVGELRPYQTIGTAFMYLSKTSMLGDGVGLGKTVETAALLNLLRERNEMTRFLMAVDISAVGQTQAEMMKFTGMNVIALPSETDKLNRVIPKIQWNTVDGIIIPHSALKSNALSTFFARNLREDGTCKVYSTFILDESSIIKNANTKTYEYTKNICDLADRVHFLNATSFETNIMDIFYQMDMMNDGILPTKWRIEKDFCDFSKDRYWKTEADEHGIRRPTLKFRRTLAQYKNQDIFKNSLKLFYLGRDKKSIGMDMPHIYKIYEVSPTAMQLTAINEGHRYMEVLNSPSTIEGLGIPTDRKSVPKLDRLVNIVQSEFSSSKVMIYCFNIEAQKAIARELKAIGRKAEILNGDTDKELRLEMQERFNTGDTDVLITSVKKSLNLYGGDVCIFYTVETNPSKLEQIRGRIDRNVDDSIKTYILLIYKDSPEYDIFFTTVKQRAQDAKDLILDAETAVDYFLHSMNESDGDSSDVGGQIRMEV